MSSDFVSPGASSPEGAPRSNIIEFAVQPKALRVVRRGVDGKAVVVVALSRDVIDGLSRGDDAVIRGEFAEFFDADEAVLHMGTTDTDIDHVLEGARGK